MCCTRVPLQFEARDIFILKSISALSFVIEIRHKERGLRLVKTNLFSATTVTSNWRGEIYFTGLDIIRRYLHPG